MRVVNVLVIGFTHRDDKELTDIHYYYRKPLSAICGIAFDRIEIRDMELTPKIISWLAEEVYTRFRPTVKDLQV